MQRRIDTTGRDGQDRGNVLPLVLVATVVLSMVVVSILGYVSASLNYGTIVEQRADRLAAADGGMRYAVERLRLGASRVCSTNGGDYIDPPDINGSRVMVRCQQVTGGFDDTSGYALILTGEEIPVDDLACSDISDCYLLHSQSGASSAKVVGGPVYMADMSDRGLYLQAPVEFRYSQLLYTDADCDASNPDLPDGTGDEKAASFDSDSLGLSCTERPWSADANPTTGMFSEPNHVVPIPTGPVNPVPTVDGNGCTIWEPGYYNVAPTLGSHNYFKSGDYVFDGVTLYIEHSKVTAGRAVVVSGSDPTPGDTQFIPNTTCNTARNVDPGTTITTAGATFYMRNGAHIEIAQHGTLEIMRRKQGKAYVSIHVLPSQTAGVNLTDMTWNDSIIVQRPGSNKDMVIHGLVWAPDARVTLDTVTNTANGQMLGGAVLSSISVGTSSSADEFAIAIEPTDLHGKMLLTSVAAKDGQTTTIRSVVDYRPSTNYTAVTSWRVVD
jgi:hypothetical protein